jgi:hypothetical protein
MRDQRGQGTVEYLAVVLVVAAALAAAMAALAGAGLGGRVMDAFRRALCVVTGGPCDEAARLAARPCVLDSRQHSEGGRLTILVVSSGDRNTVLRERRSDGSVALTLIDGRAAGLDVGSGVGLHVRWGARTWAIGSELRAAVLAGSVSGRTWIARDDAEADRMLERVRLWSLPAALRRGIVVPEPSVTFSERTGDLTLDLHAGGRLAVRLSSAQAYGERVDHAAGLRTVYLRMGRGAAGLVSFVRASVGGTDQDAERVGITYDRTGRPVDLMVLSTLDVGGAASLPARLSRIAGWLRIPLHGSKHVETEQHLDLTDPGNAEAAGVFLARAGRGQAGLALAAAALRGRLERHGTLSVRTYATEQAAHGVDGHLRLGGLGVGGEVGSEDESARMVSAVARRSDGTWADDEACERV